VKGDGDPLGGLPLSLAQTAPPARATTKSPGGSGRCASGMAVWGGRMERKAGEKNPNQNQKIQIHPFLSDFSPCLHLLSPILPHQLCFSFPHRSVFLLLFVTVFFFLTVVWPANGIP